MAVFLLFCATSCSTATGGGWLTFNGTSFTIEYPQDWSVQAKEDGLILVKNPTYQVMLWPYLVAQPLNAPESRVLLNTFAAKLFPGYTWGSTLTVGTRMLRIQGKSTSGNTAVAFLSWVSGADYTLCTFYGCNAPTTAFTQQEETFARILTSFRPKQQNNSSKPAEPKIQYKQFTDPAEQAFSLSYPSTWKIEGGSFRAAATDVRVQVHITSPDGKVLIFMGDKTLPYFTMPNQMLDWTGFREGSWYSPGYGASMLVQRYYPGVQFALQYASQLAQSQPEILEQNDRPELAQQLMGLQELSSYGVYQRMDAGDVRFRFSADGNVRTGYVFANTLKTETNGNGIWHVEQLLGYIATPETMQQAHLVLEQAVNTFQINPAWANMQSNLTANVSKIVSETHQQISGIIRETFEYKQQTLDRTNRQFDQYIRGVEQVTDEKGTVYEVKSGNNYYWINQFEEVIGTDIYQNPDMMRFRELVRIQ